ncbi:MAG: hypothetical protein IJM18_01685 [Clostridia bacterium]|nr:hypothetical protein [Clostridia bacterium]
MKRTVLFILFALLFTLLSCSPKEDAHTYRPELLPTDPPSPSASPSASPTVSPTASPEPGPGPYASECMAAAEARMAKVLEYVRANPIEFVSSSHPFVPADMRSGLEPEAAAVYDKLLAAAESFSPIELACPEKTMEAALDALFFDHPEIEICFDMEKAGGSGAAVLFRSVYFLPEGRYFKAADDIEEVKAQAEAFVLTAKHIASMIPEDLSVIDKYRCIACYISETSQYAHVHGEIPRYAMTAYGAVINGWSICQGYALGFEYLCRAAGLDCRRCRNSYSDERMHYWDIVTLDCGTYFIDVTWSDGSSYDYADPNWFTWFMFTNEPQHIPNDGTRTTGAPLDRGGWA